MTTEDPPVVVSSETLQVFWRAMGWNSARQNPTRAKTKQALAAAIRNHLAADVEDQ